MPHVADSRIRIPAPPAQPPAYSLIQVARDASLDEDALFHGWTFDPEMCGGSRGGIVAIRNNAAQGTDTMTSVAAPDNVAGDPFAIYVAAKASSLDRSLARDWIARLDRQMAAVESYWLARALAIGTDDDSTITVSQRALNAGSGTTEVTAGPTQATVALALLEEAYGDAMRGQPGQIHVTEDVLTILAADGAIRLNGQVWVTPMGNRVVCDAGYTGAGPGDDVNPTAGTSWMHATTPIRVQVGPVVHPYRSLEAALAETLDRTVNTVEMFASRPATWVWDECAHLAAQVDVIGEYGGGEGVSAATLEEVAADEGIAAANWLSGYTFQETSGSDPAAITLHNGTANTDPVVGYINLAAGESVPPTMLAKRIAVPDGLYVEVVSGAVEGTVFYEV